MFHHILGNDVAMLTITGQWLTCLKHYLLMCLLLSSPERLPYNPYCVVLSIFAYFLIGLLLVDEQRGYAVICAQILLELALLGLIAWAGLNSKKLLARFQQTFSALVGINVTISAATIPVNRLLAAPGADKPDNLLAFATLAILVWNLVVMAMIFKQAFEIPTQQSAMISFTYFLIYQFIVIWFYL